MSNKKNQQQPISPKKYIIEAARKVPIYECLINEGWQEGGMAQIMVVRRKLHGNFIVGNYVLDTFCLGLKNTLYMHNMADYEYESHKRSTEKQTGFRWEKIEPNFCFNLIYGAIEYAEDLGFKPNKDFDVTEYILDDVEKIEFEEIEFGRDGMPYYFAGPYDDVKKVINILNRSVGEGNYHYVAPVDMYGTPLSKFDKRSANHFEDDDNEPHIPMVGFDFEPKEPKKFDLTTDMKLVGITRPKTMDLDSTEYVIREAVKYDSEVMEIAAMLLERYLPKAKSTDIYFTINANSIEYDKQRMIKSFFYVNPTEAELSYEESLNNDVFIENFIRFKDFENLKTLIETSHMNRYANEMIAMIKQFGLDKTMHIETYILYGEKIYFGHADDHITIGFTFVAK